mgnify:CR=1 FL=1
MKRKFLSILLTLALALSMLPTAALADLKTDSPTAAAAVQLTDVDGHWAENAIRRWVENGVVQGNDGQFDPNGPLTCAQLATILANLLRLGAAGSAGFTDVKAGAWYEDAIDRCAAAGILMGNGDGTVDPDGAISRERAMVMLGRALGIRPAADPDLSKHSDEAQVSSYARGMVAALVAAGIVNGVDGDRLAPQDDINRASTMTILDKAIENYVKDNGASVTGTGDGVTLVVADNATVNGEIGSLLVAGDNSNVSVGSGSQLGDVNVTGNGSSVTIKDSGAGSVNVTGDHTKIILDGADAGSVSMTGDGTQLELGGDAKVGDLNVGGENTKLALGGKSEVDNVKISEGANGTTIDAGSGSTIGTVRNEAENTTVTGDGAVKNVESTTDVTVETKGTDVKNTGDADISVKGADGKESSVASGGSSSTAGTTTGTTTGGGSSSGGSSGGGSSGGGSESHSHTMVKTEAVAATCTADGHNAYYTCSDCGKVYKDAAGTTETTVAAETILALGHSWGDWTVTTPATEDSTGEESRTCEACGATETQEIPKLTHVHRWTLVAERPATCTSTGLAEHYHCEGCSAEATYSAESRVYTVQEDTSVFEIPPADHTRGAAARENVVEATCTEEGSYDSVVRCTVCEAVIESTHETIPAAGHRFENGACQVCGAEDPDIVAQISWGHTSVKNNKYRSIAEAFAAIDGVAAEYGASKAYGTVKLLKDVALDQDLRIGTNGALRKMALNGHTLTFEGDSKLIVTGNKMVTIEGSGMIKSKSAAADAYLIAVSSGASLTISGTGASKRITLIGQKGIEVSGGFTIKNANLSTKSDAITVTEGVAAELTIGQYATVQSENGSCLIAESGSNVNVTIAPNIYAASNADIIQWASSGTLLIKGGTFTGGSVLTKNAGTVSITGGTYPGASKDVLEPYFAAGYGAEDQGNGTYKVKMPDVAQIVFANGRTKNCTSLNSALSGVNNATDAKIVLLRDISERASGARMAGGSATLDLAGHTITVTGSNDAYPAAISLLKNAKLTIEDSSENNTGRLIAEESYCVTAAGSSEVTIRGGIFTGAVTAVQAESSGTVYIQGGTFKTEDTDKSYLLNCIDEAFKAGTAKIEVTGGTFYGFDPANNTAEGANTNFVKAGYASTANGDGSYTVVAEVVNP